MDRVPTSDLIARATRELGLLGLVDPADVEAGYVVRMPKAYPYYDDDYKANVEIDPSTGWTSTLPTSTPSAATACTGTTTRTTRCTRPC